MGVSVLPLPATKRYDLIVISKNWTIESGTSQDLLMTMYVDSSWIQCLEKGYCKYLERDLPSIGLRKAGRDGKKGG
jgi:hypothetical protein